MKFWAPKQGRITRFASVFFEANFYIFGGISKTKKGKKFKKVFRLTTNRSWEQVGHLNNGRFGHAAIRLSSNVVVVGGLGRLVPQGHSYRIKLVFDVLYDP